MEICGVEVKVLLSSDAWLKSPQPQAKTKVDRRKDVLKGAKVDRPRSTQPLVHDPGGSTTKTVLDSPAHGNSDAENNRIPILPTSTDLAESFLQTEPPQEKAQLHAAISESQNLHQSQLSEDGEEVLGPGLGTGFSLPGFVANFLKGVGNRLRIEVNNVEIDVDMKIEVNPSGLASSSYPTTSEHLTFRLVVDAVNMSETLQEEESFSLNSGSRREGADESAQGDTPRRHPYRRVSMIGIKVMLLSDSSLFAFVSQSSGPPSPTATHSSNNPQRNPEVLKTTSSSSSAELAMSQATILDGHGMSTGSSSSLETSLTTTDGERFGDAEIDELQPSDPHVQSSFHGDSPSVSQYSSFGYEAQSTPHLEGQSTEMLPIEDSDTLPQNSGYEHTQTHEAEQRRSHTSSTSAALPNRSPHEGGFRSSLEDPFVSTENVISIEPRKRAKSLERSYTAQNFWETRASSEVASPPDSPQSLTSEVSPFGDSQKPLGEDLTQSKIFSHEEAESMYMSAMSQQPDNKASEEPIPESLARPSSDTDEGSKNFSETTDPSKGLLESSVLENSDTAIPRQSGALDNRREALEAKSPIVVGTIKQKDQRMSPVTEETVGEVEKDKLEENLVTFGSVNSSSSSPRPTRMVKHIAFVDFMKIDLPQDSRDLTYEASKPNLKARAGPVGQSGVPGAFASVVESTSPTESVKHNTSGPLSDNPAAEKKLVMQPADTNKISIFVESLSILGDMGLTRLMIMVAQQISALHFQQKVSAKTPAGLQHPANPFRLRLDKLSWRFVDVIKGYSDTQAQQMVQRSQVLSTDSEVLLTATMEGLDISQTLEDKTSRSELSISKCTFGYASDTILSFDSAIKIRESTRGISAPTDKDVNITVSRTEASSKITISTLPLRIRLNLQRLDETFSWFGGLSSVLGLGNSMMSVATVLEVKHKQNHAPSRRAKGVRFATPENQHLLEHQTEISQNKISVRIGGLLFDLQGKESSLRLEATALKVISRHEGLGLQVDKLKFTGPHIRHSANASATAPAISTKLENIRIEYLSTPTEIDLGRLLALLAPSRDRDETDDDILLDTLLRQRRQGGVVRVTIAAVEGTVGNLDELNHLSAIMEELGKLSKVAKYLPEDDRPGILTLALVRELRLDLQVNSTFGSALVTSNNIEVAHVTLPPLVLLGISTIHVQHQGQELTGIVLHPEQMLEQQRPMIMARYIGDELEPTMKFKICNLRVEYRVSTIIALLGLTETTTGETVISEMVNSIATMKDQRPSLKLVSQASSNSERSSIGTKLLRFDVVIRDSVVALNPSGSQSRGLIVLTRTKLNGTFPKSDEYELSGSLDIRKATVMIIDNVANLTLPRPQTPTREGGPYRGQLQTLSAMGYVVVGDISAAKVNLQTLSSGKHDTKTLDIEIRDDLFVLETCADSTHTLQSILNGLKPPTPPSQELKYRTEVIPVEDMLASFSGDAYDTTGDGHGPDESPLGLDDGDMVDDEVPQNLEYVSSFYDPDPLSTADDIANSMLEDDLSSMARPPTIRKIGDKRLLQSFEEQFEVAPGSESLNFSEDHFGANSSMGGTAHKWNSDRNTYDMANGSRLRGSPLRLRMRDVHIIWNLFDGYDWQHTRDTISQAVTEVENKAADRLARKDRQKSFDKEEEEDSVIGDFLFNSIYIGIPANQDPRDLARQVNRNLDDLASETESYATSTTASGSPSRPGYVPRAKRKKLRLNRSKHHKLTFELKGVSADLVVFPPHSGETQSSLDIRVQDLEIFDHVPTSTWKKFATYMHDAGERESGTSMIHIEILNVKPVPDLAASEIILKATVLPLRLHVDQDALDFMTRFFEFKPSNTPSYSSPADIPFLQRVEVNSIRVRLDFKPKRVDYAGLRSGHTTEFMNFFILDQADMVLRHVIIYGVSGFDKLGKTLNDVWMPDIKRNQLPGVLAGLAPVRSLVNVGGGVRDLVVVPMREYRKDGRVLRSIQKGALSFAKTTTTELAKLGAKLAIGTQTVLQGAEDYLTPAAPSSQRLDHWESAEVDAEEKKHISLYADQPVGVVQGLRGAYRHLERDLLMARDAIVAMPGEVMESDSAGGMARAVLRGAPTVILRPALGVTKAVGQTLLGATNSLDHGERRRVEDVSHATCPPFQPLRNSQRLFFPERCDADMLV